MMNLDDAQKKTVTTWIAEGLKLSDIQKRIGTDFGVTLTYMEVRLLVDDLKLTPKDAEPPKAEELGASQAASGAEPQTTGKGDSLLGRDTPAKPGAVTVTVDSIARPGTVASGKVTFTDGNAAEWYLDEMGRLGLMPKQEGYRPSQQDVLTFQTELQNQLAKLGM